MGGYSHQQLGLTSVDVITRYMHYVDTPSRISISIRIPTKATCIRKQHPSRYVGRGLCRESYIGIRICQVRYEQGVSYVHYAKRGGIA